MIMEPQHLYKTSPIHQFHPQQQHQQQQHQNKSYHQQQKYNNKNYNASSSMRYSQFQPQQQQQQQQQHSNVDYNNNNNSQFLGDSPILREKLIKLNINVDSNKARPQPQQQTSPPAPLTPTVIRADQPIWKSFIYDPNTSIYLIKREKIDTRFIMNKQYLNDIAAKSSTKINFYANGDMNENSTTVYFTVNGVYEARCNALEMLRDETGKAGVIVNLPSLISTNDERRSQLKSNLTRQINSSSSQAGTSGGGGVKKHCSFAIDDINSDKQHSSKSTAAAAASSSFKRTKSFHNKFDLDQQEQEQADKNSFVLNPTPPPPRTSSSKPQQLVKSSFSHARKRYTTEFLLSRADTPHSKEIPKDWPDLHLKYPNICFCGRVISYFNPYKYQAYWMKIKQLNQHLHL